MVIMYIDKLLRRYKSVKPVIKDFTEVFLVDMFINLTDKNSDSYEYINISQFFKGKDLSLFGKIITLPFYLCSIVILILFSIIWSLTMLFIWTVVFTMTYIIKTIHILMTNEPEDDKERIQ